MVDTDGCGASRRTIGAMAHLLLLTDALDPSAAVLPALGLLPHHVKVLQADASAALALDRVDAVLVDARRDLAAAKALCRVLRSAQIESPLFAVLTEGGLVAMNGEWGVDEILLDSAGPAEVEARLRLAAARATATTGTPDGPITAGELVIDEAAYTARVSGRHLDLTYKEFELLKHLAGNPGRVFTRDQLLAEVWGYDYFGGTRTVDVHVRRLRAKLGSEHDAMIGTVRNVGYRFVPPEDRRSGA